MGQKISVQQYRGPKGTILFIYGKSTAGKKFTGPQANREEGENFSLSLIKQAIARSAAKGKKCVAPEAKKDLKKSP